MLTDDGQVLPGGPVRFLQILAVSRKGRSVGHGEIDEMNERKHPGSIPSGAGIASGRGEKRMEAAG